MTGNPKLGEFLRSRRARLRPAELGLVTQGRRRIAGLRREEVARLAGISAEWYMKLEQGRAVSPSAATIDALGTALRLDPVELRHLRLLAGADLRPPFARESVPAPLARIVAGMSNPAYVTGQRWDVLAWNAAAADLVTDFARFAEADRNILLFMLTDPQARRLFGPTWADEACRMISLFRATFDLWAADASFAALVARLQAGCAEFSAWWAGHAIAAPTSGQKTLHHDIRGPVRVEYASFQANDDPRLKLAIYIELT